VRPIFVNFFSSTGQVFFDDEFTDQIAHFAPYLSHNITRVLNNVDGIFNGQGGSSSLLSVELISNNTGLPGGVIASITLGINSSAIPDSIQGGGDPSPTPLPTPLPTSTIRSKADVATMINSALIFFHFVFIFFY
jgi:hypothetical protein